ncbi:hypothetical protein AKJ55_00665 [candidate division MSBL1 archaeon SCGC-AAA382M17]|uniref:HTH asnC-type domain-containing protein n=1 Tax=candidate division MSBL1 archaeon SCGC-AAA382M17 TaxID=1698284 RepID=A0ABR5TJT4_9EURY|nr:hypothetical protein AKJ55_00665 [candidate division MSBL1 archaeon SCGC-AAA382M17]
MKSLDKKILLQLLEDADRPIVDIANNVGASRQTVSKKIKRFKDSGLVQDLTAKLDPEKFGLNVRAYVFLQEDPQVEIRGEDEEKINQLPQVSKFFRLFGRYSGVLEVWTKNRDELTSLVKKIHELEGIRETETFIVHSVAKDKPEDPLLSILKED